MKENNIVYEGERALFKAKDIKVEHATFRNGESPLKEARNVEVEACSFQWKYPLWYGKNLKVKNCHFEETARAGIWYTEHTSFLDNTYDAPKLFRKCRDIEVINGHFTHGLETFWWNSSIKVKNLRVDGDYAFMKCDHVYGEDIDVHGGYAFDGCEEVELHHCNLITKDAFWNCKNITCYDSNIECEYFGWNSENITLVRCRIKSHQGFCYMKNIKLIDCVLEETDLSFEYCEDIDATVLSHIDSIKNPLSGIIRCKSVGGIILDDDNVDHSKCEIIVNGQI